MPESSEPTAGPAPRTDEVVLQDEAAEGSESATTLPTEGDEERTQRLLQEKDDTIRAMREQMLRMQADFENYKRRQQNNLEDARFLAREGIIGNLLPLLDNFERALQAFGTTANVKALADGCQLILRQAGDILSREGLSEIEADGRIFDPAVHEAVMREERDDIADQTIVQTLQKGYRLGNRVLRPSMVKVATHPGPEGPATCGQ